MTFDEITVGQTAEFAKTITEFDIGMFAGITGDFNPLHVNRVVAEQSRFGGRIAHGMLTASLISTVIGMYLPGPGCVYLGQTLRFTRPVKIGDTVTVTVEVLEKVVGKRRLRLATVCTNQNGEKVIDGEATVLVPETV
jgi:3-hydroxybutyryl-CoA dehydratase